MLAFAAMSLGCPHRAETTVADASAPDVTRVAVVEAPPAGTVPVDETPGGAPPDAGTAVPREEACVDDWLAARKLDRFGRPQGTMYTGGTPLFDERTGERTDRLVYVYGRHPEARADCGSGAAPDGGPASR